MTETAHTPLPWVANDKHSGANPWRIENDEGVYANGGWIIAECMGPDAKANADLIVQAVNSHHRLIEALEAFAFVGEDDPKDTQAVWEMIYRDRVQDWFSYEDFERARDLLAALKEAGR